MLNYTYDEAYVEITETKRDGDTEFRIRSTGAERLGDRLRLVQQQFEHNGTVTDVLFYAYVNGEYSFIVREDFYIDFILALLKYRIVTKTEWS